MKFWHWLRGRPSVDADHQADQRELDDLKQEYSVKMRRSESLRQEILLIEYPKLKRLR